METFSELLIVDDDFRLREALVEVLAPLAQNIRCADSAASAAEALDEKTPDAIVLDFALGDGDAFDVMQAAKQLAPAPIVIAISGTAEPQETFRLAEMGVRAFLPKPLRLDDLVSALQAAASSPPDLTPLLKQTVGHVPVQEVEASVRDTMVDEALARADGSRREAAKSLSISRQLLQFILKKRLPAAD